ncbi:hypothetical protein BDZ89DRAFT_1161353 [Hymenopellis radicata]|nr:hypothetical protein BDZ89DRAFT_1161353 [Hymenopellis radicata]
MDVSNVYPIISIPFPMSFGPAMPRIDEHNSYPLQPLKSPTELSITSDTSTLRANSSGINSTDSSHTGLCGHSCFRKPTTSNDSFDYEQKYPADEEFKEMAPAARVWMTYNDEALKYVVESVEDWREGLDMLLVFAAIFSAVVTTFVVQTCQDLRVDYGEVTAILILELINLQFELAKGASPNDLSPPSTMKAASAFHAKRSDLFWIHQYMAIPSGSPRRRARTRQFRNDSFQKWNVPLIIGLLPVLMHLSLGIFFVGLVIYLHNLSGIIAATLGCIGGLAFLVYFSSNLLPLFFPDCPYKTPLSHYAYVTLSYARRRFSCLWEARRRTTGGTPPNEILLDTPPDSLKDVEGRLVFKNADKLDARAIVWMHNASPSLSVQSIALQAISSLPLQSVKIIEGAEGILPSVRQAIEVHHRLDQPVDRFERFQRTAIRTGDGRLMLPTHEPNRYTRLLHCSPAAAVKMLQEHLLHTSIEPERKLDVVFWARIFQNALRSGLDWLEISQDGPPSRIWEALLEAAIGEHSCTHQNCDGKRPELRSFSLECGPLKNSELVINSYDLTYDGTTTELTCALANNMGPSFVRWLLHVGFPTASRSAANYTQHVPEDVFLMLTMLQSKSIQQTSRIPEDDDTEDDETESLFYRVLKVVQFFAIGAGLGRSPHKDIDRAAIVALRAVVNYDYFGTGTIMISQDEAFVVKSLFRGLNRRYEFSGPDDHDYTWLTSDVFTKIWRVASAVNQNSAELVAHILTYVSSTGSHSYATDIIMSDLIARDWLQDFASRLTRLAQSTNPRADKIPEDIRPGYTYLAGAYADAFFALSATPPSAMFIETLEYISKLENLNALCTLLFFSDVDMQRKVWRLAQIVQCDHWPVCLQNLTRFVTTAGAILDYEGLTMFRISELRLNRMVYYQPFNDFPVVVRMLAKNIQDKHYVPPLFTKPDTPTSDTELSSQSSTSQRSYWRRLIRPEPPQSTTSPETGQRASLEWSKNVAPYMNIIPNP